MTKWTGDLKETIDSLDHTPSENSTHQTYSYNQNILMHCREDEEKKYMKHISKEKPEKTKRDL